MNNKNVSVIFDMWGQRCVTEFDETSELDPLTWAKTVYEKGYMAPIEIVRGDGLVLYTEKDFKYEF